MRELLKANPVNRKEKNPQKLKKTLRVFCFWRRKLQFAMLFNRGIVKKIMLSDKELLEILEDFAKF